MADEKIGTRHKLVIVGSGPAGLTAAIYGSRANLKPLIIEGKSPGGQLMGTTYVENWPGDKSILGPTLMMKMREHAKQFGTQFLSEEVVRVDFSKRPFTLVTDKDTKLQADSVVIASGAVPRRLDVPGEQEYWGKGVTTCAVCDGAFYKDKKVLIIGGGDTAMEDASFMTKFTDQITVVQILGKLTASKPMQKRVLDNPKIEVIYNTTVGAFQGDGSHVTGVTLIDQKTKEQRILQIDGVFLAIGLLPKTDYLKDQIKLDKFGYVVIKDHTKTSVKGVFVGGDAADWRYRQAVTSAGTGCMAVLDAERWLASQEDSE